MSVQFEWQTNNGEGRWETTACIGKPAGRGRLRPASRWVWYALIAAAVLLAVSGYVAVRRRYNEARRQLIFQIQSVVDLEARAFAENDRALFLAQQDQTLNWWYEEQQRRISPRCQQTRGSVDRWPDPCFPVLPARVEDVDMRGSVVLVKVSEGQPPLR